jgi:hypothetical protein
MTEQHPIIPSYEQTRLWAAEAMKGWRTNGLYERDIANFAAQWGADQELEACCAWLQARISEGWNPCHLEDLRNARRPKPQTLNSIAMQMLGTIERDGHYIPEITDTIRRALKQLND